MGLEIRQQLKLSQQLKMTPQLQQAIKLLQLSRMELIERVREEMEENPVLEEGAEGPQEQKAEGEGDAPDRPVDMAMEGIDSERAAATPEPVTEASNEVPGEAGSQDSNKEVDWDAYLEHHTLAPPMPSYRPNNDELPSIEATYTRKPSLYDHLVWQLRMADLDEEEERIGMLIIGNIDPRGYFAEPPLEEIAKLAGCEMIVADDILSLVHSFDPLGVGARDLAECLLIQAKHVGQDDEVICRILKDHIPNLERKNYQAICKDLDQPLDEIIEAVKVIQTFDPKPGRLYADEDPVYITPDVYVHKIGEKYFVVPNDDGMPKLKISNFYRAALRGGTKERQYVQDKLRSAQWLIRSIQQRQRTIIRVTESIVRFQQEFFDKGINNLRPLILRDVAEDIGMHESTISRVTTAKYVHTPQGIFELKFFFNSGINRMQGEDIASESVKKKIKDIVSREDGKRPFSDQKIVELLRDQNIDIARRTVAKYREQMGILSSSKRKQLF